MPRKPDRHLQSRILNAAYRLWVRHGDHGLTMRAVAKAARTTTPTLYERFRDKDALMSALRRRAQQKLYNAVQSTRSITDACRVALEFSSTHRHEYELISQDFAHRLAEKQLTPSFDVVKARLASQLGGSPDDHTQLALSIAILFHGTSMLLLPEALDPTLASFLKETCISAVEALLEDARRKLRTRAAD